MSALQYPISDSNPVRIAAGLQGTLTLYNEDSMNTVFVSEYPNNNGFPLSPGMTISWDKDKPLYAYVVAGSPAMLDVLDNGGQISSPLAIANQLLASGLAAKIAQNIAVSGAPPIDPLINLRNSTQAVAANAGFNDTWLNVGGYQSVNIRAAEDTGGTVYGTPIPRRITIWWSDANNGIPIYEESFLITDTNGNAFGTLVAFATYRTSVKAAWMQIQWSGTTRAATLDYTVIGSYKTLTRPEYQLQNAGYSAPPAGWASYGNALDRTQAIYTSSTLFTNNVLYWWYPSVSAGLGYRMSVITPGSGIPTGGSFDIFIYSMQDGSGDVYLWSKRSYTGPFPVEDDSQIIFPFAPVAVLLRYNNATAGTWAPTVTLSLTYER